MRDRLLVLLSGEGIDGAELLAAAGEAVDAGGELGAAVVVERLGGRLGRQAEALGRDGKRPGDALDSPRIATATFSTETARDEDRSVRHAPHA
ncbi:MAG TPA: hypothetical protein VHF90_00105, partial [Thermoleophilaceae bacterium]|nr:hypothetical protein [Thermoleophilaceae bacterium]